MNSLSVHSIKMSQEIHRHTHMHSPSPDPVFKGRNFQRSLRKLFIHIPLDLNRKWEPEFHKVILYMDNGIFPCESILAKPVCPLDADHLTSLGLSLSFHVRGTACSVSDILVTSVEDWTNQGYMLHACDHKFPAPKLLAAEKIFLWGEPDNSNRT